MPRALLFVCAGPCVCASHDRLSLRCRLLFVVDVLNEEATFLASSPTAARLVEQAWGCTLDASGACVLPGVLSRKKQIIPTLEAGAAPAPPASREAVGVTPMAQAGVRVPASAA